VGNYDVRRCLSAGRAIATDGRHRRGDIADGYLNLSGKRDGVYPEFGVGDVEALAAGIDGDEVLIQEAAKEPLKAVTADGCQDSVVATQGSG